LAVVLVSNPERYHGTFSRPYNALIKALDRLKFIASCMALAKTGFELLQTILRRVVEAQQRIPIVAGNMASNANVSDTGSIASDNEPWRFEVDMSVMDWTAQQPGFSALDLSTFEVPVPLKELFLDEGLSELPDSDLLAQGQENTGLFDLFPSQYPSADVSENQLWNFLIEIPPPSKE
jgi:hypothetical protein